MNIYPPSSMLADQYEVVSAPMMGGMGVVYFCLDHGNKKKPVALKTFKPEFLPDREARDRFLREGTAWVSLGSHPHIVKCHAVEYIDPTAFLVLELIAKEKGMEDASLRAWIGSPMKVEHALLFTLQVARGLQHATAKIPGFVHRDLKPENVLVGADKLFGTNINRLRVTDFGLAAILNKTDSTAKGLVTQQEKALSLGDHLNLVSIGHVAGTPEYMAPEQWEQGTIDCRADIYALGCILLEMLSGQTAVRTVPRRACRELHKSGEALRKAAALLCISQDVRFLLEKSLAVNPDHRYTTWNDLIKGLEESYALQKGDAAPADVATTQVNHEEKIQDGLSYKAIGLAYQDMGKVELAKDYFGKSLSIAREIENRSMEGAVLGDLGSSYFQLGQIRRATEYYEQALAIDRELKDRDGEGADLGNLGLAYAALGEVQHAIIYYEQALTILRETGDRNGEGATLGNLGLAYAALGEIRHAIECYEKAMAILCELGDRRGEGATMGNLGAAYYQLGDIQRAIGYYQQRIEIAHQIGDRRGEGNALGSLGLVYEKLGEAKRAIGYYEQNLVVTREIKNRNGEGTALANLGNVYYQQKERGQAIKNYEQALTIFHEIGNRRGKAKVLGNLGNLYLDLGEVHRAIGYFEQQLEVAREIGNRQGEGAALGNLGNGYSDLGEVRHAIEYYEQAITIRREISDANGIAIDSFNMAKLYSEQGDISRALPLAQEAERIWSQISSPNLQAARQLVTKLQSK